MNRSPVSSATARAMARRGSPWRSRRGAQPSFRFAADSSSGMVEAMDCEALSIGAVSRPARRIRSIFFDTAANDLGKGSVVLRGYKLRGASFLEMTWTTPSPAGLTRAAVALRVPTLDIGTRLLDADASGSLRRSLQGRPFEARCVTETTRCERLLDLPRARIAVTFDEGFVEFSGERTPFHEIELRLIEGETTQLVEFAAHLSRRLPIRLLARSEAETGPLRMAGGAFAPVKASPVAVPRDTSLDEAITAMLGSCLDQFVANWPALTQSGDPEEGIHQMRVSLRRLRAGVGLLRPAINSSEIEEAGARAKDIAATLGDARNWGVLRDMLLTGPLAGMHKEPAFHVLLDAVNARGASGHEKVRALIAAPQTTQFVLDLRAALAGRAWTKHAASQAGAAANKKGAEKPALEIDAPGSARDFAICSLDRLHRRAMKKGRRLASLPPDERHKARIALKKSRYAAEFFESLFDDRAGARNFRRVAAAIQDSLGAFNDMAMVSRLLREIDDERGQKTASATRFVVGWYAHAQSKMAADWEKDEKSLKKLKPFWR